MPRCRAPTQDGTLCRKRVTKAGELCHVHKRTVWPPSRGRTAPRPKGAPSRSGKRRQTTGHSSLAPGGGRRPSPDNRASEARKRREEKRVRDAVEACADIITAGWIDAVSARAGDYVSAEIWRQLSRGRRRRHCRTLAQIARLVLAGKDLSHQVVGTAAQRLMSLAGRPPIEQLFARELAARIPLPTDAKLVATARGVQIAGIALCVLNDDDLLQCQCFIDLALAETKARLRQILSAAVQDWVGLGAYAPKTPPPTA